MVIPTIQKTLIMKWFFAYFLLGLHAFLYSQDILRERAWKGDTLSALQLCENYMLGLNGYPQNNDSAKIFLYLALEKKHPDAMYLAGVGYYRGFMFQKDVKKGLELLNQAADAGNLQALQVLFDIYANPDTSLFVDKKNFVKMDSALAVKYALRAAEKGQTWAMYELGYAYFQGSGTKKNDSLAIYWMDQAAQRMHSKAQLTLGDWFFKGVTQYGPDLLKSRHYYAMAEKNPYADIEDATWGLVGVHNTYQVFKEFYNFYAFVWYVFTLEDLRIPWDGNSQKFMLDREKYIREMEASQQKKIQEYEKKLKEKQKIEQELMNYAKKLRETRDNK